MSTRTLTGLALGFALAISPQIQAADEALVQRAKENAQPAPENAPAKPAQDKPAAPPAPAPPVPAAGQLQAAPPAAQPAPPAAPQELEIPGRVKPLVRRAPNNNNLPRMAALVDELSKEARKSWIADRDWPRNDADYSSRTDAAPSNRQLLTAIAARADSHPAVDAYIRWQLLSFVPDLHEANVADMRKIMSTMPGLTRLPVPPEPRNVLKGGDQGGGAFMFSGVQKAFLSDLRPIPGTPYSAPTLSVVNSGSGIGLNFDDPQEVIERCRGAAYDLVQSRAVVERMNLPATRYRDALISLLPRDGGYRIEAMFDDMIDRLKAGDATFKKSAQAFYDEAFATRNDPTIPQKLRLELIANLRNWGGRTTYIVKEIEIDRAGNMRVAKDAIAFPKDAVERTVEALKGPQQAEEKK